MTIIEAIILGIVEGLTEFIPVSSTGHLILTKSLLGMDDSADSFLVGIQLGALIAVAIYYRARVGEMLRGLTDFSSQGFKLATNLVIAFMPAAVIGLLIGEKIKEKLFNPMTVAAALLVGGILMIAVEKWQDKKTEHLDSLEQVTWRDALFVGFAQCFAMWPGMSRSMSTIVGGQMRGMTANVAADFSFLLALPTLGAATVYSLLKDREFVTMANMPAISVGLITSFVVGWAAVAWFLKVLKRVGMTPFGIYRIVLAGISFGAILMERFREAGF